MYRRASSSSGARKLTAAATTTGAGRLGVTNIDLSFDLHPPAPSAPAASTTAPARGQVPPITSFPRDGTSPTSPRPSPGAPSAW